MILLTEKLYKITLLFPKQESLRHKMREMATAIFEDFVGISFLQNFKQSGTDLLLSLDVLDGFFELAKKQNWVKEEEVLAIRQEYANFKAEIFEKYSQEAENEQQLRLPESPEFREPHHLAGFAPPEITAEKEKVNPRQRTILDFLKENGRVQVWQVKEIFPDISKRTLRRDFEYMLKQGIVERIGQRNDTFYQVKVVAA